MKVLGKTRDGFIVEISKEDVMKISGISYDRIKELKQDSYISISAIHERLSRLIYEDPSITKKIEEASNAIAIFQQSHSSIQNVIEMAERFREYCQRCVNAKPEQTEEDV